MEKDWVLIYSNTSQYEAEILSAVLKDHDIDSVSVNKKDSSYHFGEIEIYVKRDSVIKAKKIITENNF